MKKAPSNNVKYIGCRSDYPLDHPEYQADRFYNTDISGSEIKVSTNDARLPERHKTKFFTYLGSPVHQMPSIDYVLDESRHPRGLDMKEAVGRCYEKAKLHGKKYFALQDDGVCMASDKLVGDELPISKCKSSKSSKKGGKFTNSVYEIQDLEYADTWNDTKDEAEFFKQFQYPTPVIGDRMLAEAPKNTFFDLSRTQLFVQKYVTPQNPIKGIIFNQSTASGKTCACLNSAGNFMSGSREERDPDKWRVFWITRASLREVPDGDMFGSICLSKLRAMIDDPDTPIATADGTPRAGGITKTTNPEMTQDQIDAKNRLDKIKAIQTRDQSIRMLLANQFGIEIQRQRIVSYDDFVKLLIQQTKADAELHQSQVRHSDFGFKTLFIMDEAQNWTSDELPAPEREWLDKQFTRPVTISGKVLYDRSDVFGKKIAAGILQGRDLLPAMLHRSYQLSGDNSAKIIYATATVDNLAFLLNSILPRESDRISMNVVDHYDKFSMQLKPEFLDKLARACSGRISHVNVSEIPDQFAIKLFDSIHTSQMQDFHRDILAKQLAENPKDTDSVYHNISCFAQVTGAVYSHRQIQQYEANLQITKNWNGNQSREQQTQVFLAGFDAARKAFGLEPTPKDETAYKQKLAAFTKFREAFHKFSEKQRLWLLRQQFKTGTSKPHGAPLPVPEMDPAITSILDAHAHLVSFEHWNDPEFSVVIPIEVRRAYDAKFREYKVSRDSQNEIVGSDGFPMSLAHYWRRINPLSGVQRSRYEQLVQKYEAYRAQVAAFRADHENREKWALVSRSTDESPKQPELPVGLRGFSVDGLTAPNIEDWVARTRFVSTGKQFTDEQFKYVQFLINDPASQKQRLKTLEEFVMVEPMKPVWDKTPEDSGFSFLCWSKKFNAARARELLKYYAPMVNDVIHNIIRIEQEAFAKLGHGFKHMVFTLASGSSKKFPNHGSRSVLSAFAAFPDVFEIMVQHAETRVTKKQKDAKGNEIDVTTEKFQFINNPKSTKWGVTCMSSNTIPAENIPGNEDSYPKELDFEKAKTMAAVQNSWSGPDNKFGERIKVIVLDNPFSEGINITETEIVHLMGCPKSTRKLQQIISRTTRQRKSQNLDFYEGIGAFVHVHFYELFDPVDNNTVYDQMIANMDYTEKLTNALTDTINDLLPEFSVDYALTAHLRAFNPIHVGRITHIEPRLGYVVTMHAKLRGEPHDLSVVVDADSIVDHTWKRGDEVYSTSRKEHGFVASVGSDIMVAFKDLEELAQLADLRLPVGTEVRFHIPSGVKLATKILNVGGINDIVNSAKAAEKLEHPIRLLDVTLENATDITFLSDPKFFLLGMFGMVTLLNEAKLKVELDVVLPSPTQKYYLEPDPITYAMKWTCSESQRVLQFDPSVLSLFLSPKTGMSVMVLILENVLCDSSEPRQLVNWLIYCPEQQCVERFDPRGQVPHAYDNIALDARLFEMFKDLNYMSSSMRDSFLQTKTGLAHANVVSLIYMHARVLHFASSKLAFVPQDFQASLLNYLNKKSDRQIGRYAAGYTRKLLDIKSRILKSRDYEDAVPFWTNAVIQLQSGLDKLRSGASARTRLDSVDDLASNVFRAFD